MSSPITFIRTRLPLSGSITASVERVVNAVQQTVDSLTQVPLLDHDVVSFKTVSGSTDVRHNLRRAWTHVSVLEQDSASPPYVSGSQTDRTRYVTLRARSVVSGSLLVW